MNAVAAALLMLCLTGCSTTVNRAVNLKPEHLSCEVDAECTTVRATCASCFDTPVNQSAAPGLIEERRALCRNHRGPISDCATTPPPVCQENRCVTPTESPLPAQD